MAHWFSSMQSYILFITHTLHKQFHLAHSTSFISYHAVTIPKYDSIYITVQNKGAAVV